MAKLCQKQQRNSLKQFLLQPEKLYSENNNIHKMREVTNHVQGLKNIKTVLSNMAWLASFCAS